MSAKILLAEDDETLGFLLQAFLESRQFEVIWAKDGVEALRAYNADPSFDLCLLDVMMPALDGLTVAELLRQRRPELPLIFLTAKSLHADVLRGFRAGADDYIKKPVNEDELVARIEAVLKRSAPIESPNGASSAVRAGGNTASAFYIGHYLFDSEKLTLTLGENTQTLTELEAKLLKMLCQSGSQLLQRDYVLEKIWGRNDFLARKSMDVFISRLRRCLSGDERVKIVNVHGSGFVLEIPHHLSIPNHPIT